MVLGILGNRAAVTRGRAIFKAYAWFAYNSASQRLANHME